MAMVVMMVMLVVLVMMVIVDGESDGNGYAIDGDAVDG